MSAWARCSAVSARRRRRSFPQRSQLTLSTPVVTTGACETVPQPGQGSSSGGALGSRGVVAIPNECTLGVALLSPSSPPTEVVRIPRYRAVRVTSGAPTVRLERGATAIRILMTVPQTSRTAATATALEDPLVGQGGGTYARHELGMMHGSPPAKSAVLGHCDTKNPGSVSVAPTTLAPRTHPATAVQ